MRAAIRRHLRDVTAVATLIVVALTTSWYILQQQRLRIPFLEEAPFELKAEFETAQAVVPGQGQAVRVAGVKVGDVEDVGLEDGRAVVTFAIERDELPVYRDATVLLRPQTGLKDMFFELDPGSESAGAYQEGDTIPAANTAPDVNLDEILAALDADTQAYLRLLLVGAGEGLDGRDRDLGRLLGGLGPINRDLRRLSSEVARRRSSLETLIHNSNLLTQRVARADEDLTSLVSTANTTLGAIARQDPSVRQAVELLPGTLETARRTLGDVAELAAILGQTASELRPFARNLEPANESLASLAEAATPVLHEEIRPFVREAREPVPDLERAARRYSSAAPRLTVVARKLNRLTNMAAYNPRGAEPVGTAGRDEGYLYWLAWLGHNGNSVFTAADANGIYRRIYFTAGCAQLRNMITGGEGGLNPADLGQITRGAITGLAPLLAEGGECGE
jgi:phospholipid/cholesterol/gamma-HCH transport system substrate-binding protein